MQASNIASDFGFKLVENRACTDLEAATANPDCLRTATQVKNQFYPTVDAGCVDGDYAVENPSKCGPIRGESCFAGSSATTATLSVLVALLSVVAVLLAAA